MASTSEYLQQLQNDKATLVDNLNTKGVTASDDETFTELVPKVLDIQSSENIHFDDAKYMCYNNARIDDLKNVIKVCSGASNMSSMFSSANVLSGTLDLSELDTSNVTTMNSMFSGCPKLESVIFGAYDTQKNTNIQYMFQNCYKLINVDWGGINTSNVTYANGVFYNCRELISIDISNIDSSGFTMDALFFQGCTNLTKVIINRQDVFKMTATSFFANTPIASGTGYVYVPDNMVETYKSATNWSDYSSQIKGMSELPTEEV